MERGKEELGDSATQFLRIPLAVHFNPAQRLSSFRFLLLAGKGADQRHRELRWGKQDKKMIIYLNINVFIGLLR